MCQQTCLSRPTVGSELWACIAYAMCAHTTVTAALPFGPHCSPTPTHCGPSWACLQGQLLNQINGGNTFSTLGVFYSFILVHLAK